MSNNHPEHIRLIPGTNTGLSPKCPYPENFVESGSNWFELQLPLWLGSRLLSQPLLFGRNLNAYPHELQRRKGQHHFNWQPLPPTADYACVVICAGNRLMRPKISHTISRLRFLYESGLNFTGGKNQAVYSRTLVSHPISPPWAVLGGFLELEGRAGQGVPRQRPGGRGVHWACCHSIARSCRGEEGGGACTCLKEEVPGGGEERQREKLVVVH